MGVPFTAAMIPVVEQLQSGNGGDNASIAAWFRADGLPVAIRYVGQTFCDGTAKAALEMMATGALRVLLKAPVLLYRLRLGFLLGERFLLLEHRGRRSGRMYRTVLEVVCFDRDRGEAVVMSGWGRTAGWYRKVTAGGALAVQLGRRRFAPEVRVLGVEQAAAALAAYERRNRILAPVIGWVLSRLGGFRYDGSAEARLRIVEVLPLVGFRVRA